MVKAKSKSTYKTWLTIGVSVVVLGILFAVFYSMIVSKEGAAPKEAMAGKAGAQLTPEQSEEFCQQMEPKGALHWTDTTYSSNVDKDDVGGCCSSSLSKNGCYSPSIDTCVNTGKVHDNYANYFCSDNQWQVCNEAWKGVVRNGEIDVDGTYYKNDGTKVIATKEQKIEYICNGKNWIGCGEGNAGDKMLKNQLLYFCDGTKWQNKEIGLKPASTYLVTSSMREFVPIPFVGGLWVITEPWYTSNRVGWCEPTKSCITKGGGCYNYDDIVNKNSLCQVGDWKKCSTAATGLTSLSGKHICDGTQWLTCTATLDDTDSEVSGNQCKDGYWVDKQKCSNIPAGKKCVVSDVVRKTNNNKKEYEVVKFAYGQSGNYVGGISVQDPNSCVYYENDQAKTIKYDVFDPDTFISKNYLCGDNNDWLLCDKDSANIVSDGGKYICGEQVGSWRWLEIKAVSGESNTKGCSKCTSDQLCVVSDMNTIIDGKWKVGMGSDLSNFAFSTGRAGCVNEVSSCVDKSGTERVKGHLTNDVTKLCGIKNNWFECTSTGAGQLRNDNGFLCTKDQKWKGCSSSGTITDDNFLCTDEGWDKCEHKGMMAGGYLSENNPSFFCDSINKDTWKKCTKDGDVVGTKVKYICDNNKWTKKTTEEAPTTETLCSDGKDDDGDKLIDCADADCKNQKDSSGKFCTGSIIATYSSTLKMFFPTENSVTPDQANSRAGWCNTGADSCITGSKGCSPKGGFTSAKQYFCAGSSIWWKCDLTAEGQLSEDGKYECKSNVWVETAAAPPAIDCKDSTNWNKGDCEGSSCGAGSIIVGSSIQPGDKSTVYGCCKEDQCRGLGFCKNINDVPLGDGSQICGASNDWFKCDATQTGEKSYADKYTCTLSGTAYKWVETAAAPSTVECKDSTNWGKAECENADCGTEKKVVWSDKLDWYNDWEDNDMSPSQKCCGVNQCALKISPTETNCYDNLYTTSSGILLCKDNDWLKCDSVASATEVEGKVCKQSGTTYKWATATPAQEICINAIDDDGDGKTDCLDSDCASDAACKTVTLGDVNGDTLVDSSDALAVLKGEVGLITLTSTQLTAGDVNCDTFADGSDALFILKKEVGLITKFPCES